VRKVISSVLLLALVSASAFAEPTLVTINGKAIDQDQFDLYLQSRTGNTTADAATHQQILEEYINRELIYLAALKQNIDTQKETRLRIEDQKRNIVTGSFLNQIVGDADIKEEQLKSVYNEQVVKNASQEYKARHILLETEETANEVIAKLMNGESFEELAKNFSIGPSKTDGGDLGWFTLIQMTPAFSEAVAKLNKNTYTQRAVQTEFGWHVIKLEDTRPAPVPTLENIRPQLVEALQRELISNYIEDLREGAQIVYPKPSAMANN